MRASLRIFGSASLVLLITSCSASSPPPTAAAPEPAAEELSSERVHEVRIEVAPADWDAIRNEGRSVNDLYSGCVDPSFEYSWVDAEVRLDERKLGKVRLRKKGYFGSLSANRPSLRIDVDEYTPEQRVFGSKTLVLNNSLQDPSFTHQCMAYAAFAAAGVPAPRCGFARVRVNGESLGHYVIVEPIKKPFLQRELGEDRGVLLEGNAGADFVRQRLSDFEVDSGDALDASEPLAPLTAALEAPDGMLRERLEAVLDLPAFMRFWAMETLVGHWDGYSGDLNNFYVYLPQAGGIQFIPSGTDGAFRTDHPYLPAQNRPQSVFAVGRLARRLYALEESREQYRSTLRELLREAWDEKTLQAEVDRIAGLIADADPVGLDAQREFIRSRRSQLLAELDADAPPWPFPERRASVCREDANSLVRATFDVTWSELSAIVPSPRSSLDVQIDNARSAYALILGSAGMAPEGKPSFQVLGQEPAGTYIVLQLLIDPRSVRPGEVPMHGSETIGVVVRAASRDSYDMIGYVGEGSIFFDEVGTSEGARLRGRVEGQLVTLVPELAALLSRR